MTEQVIPFRFGQLRRWFYTKRPLKDVCPLTYWKHRWLLDIHSENFGGDDLLCDCGVRGYMDYGR